MRSTIADAIVERGKPYVPLLPDSDDRGLAVAPALRVEPLELPLGGDLLHPRPGSAVHLEA